MAVVVGIAIILAVCFALEAASRVVGLGHTVLASLVVLVVALWGLVRSLGR
jgi:hypothetical protein